MANKEQKGSLEDFVKLYKSFKDAESDGANLMSAEPAAREKAKSNLQKSLASRIPGFNPNIPIPQEVYDKESIAVTGFTKTQALGYYSAFFEDLVSQLPSSELEKKLFDVPIIKFGDKDPRAGLHNYVAEMHAAYKGLKDMNSKFDKEDNVQAQAQYQDTISKLTAKHVEASLTAGKGMEKISDAEKKVYKPFIEATRALVYSSPAHARSIGKAFEVNAEKSFKAFFEGDEVKESGYSLGEYVMENMAGMQPEEAAKLTYTIASSLKKK